MLGKWNQLYIDLNQLSDQGIVLFLDDCPATPDLVLQALCHDNADYMRDYIYEKGGKTVKEIHFNKINEK